MTHNVADAVVPRQNEKPGTGFVPVDGNLNKGTFGRRVTLCLERDPTKSPVTDIVVLEKDVAEVFVEVTARWIVSR